MPWPASTSSAARTVPSVVITEVMSPSELADVLVRLWLKEFLDGG